MSCQLSEDELLSGLDREAPAIREHILTCAACRTKAEEYQRSVNIFSSAAAPPEQPLPERIGSYHIHKRLGHGGMGVVYEAEQQVPKRMVAIKVVRGGHHVDEYRARLLEREAETLAKLRHPGIAAIFEGGRAEDGQPFFAMELVRGIPLNEFIRSTNPTRRARLELFRRVCHAINYAHQRGVIHRDLKPTNVLIDGEGNPKILDFGLARITDPGGTIKTETLQIGRLMGTLPYMSPEEALGNPDDIDIRTDVYSLGVVLFEMLTGELPHALRGRGIPESIRIICEDAPRRPGAIDRTLRGDLETIALKTLEKNPSRRYQSVAQMSEDIERFLKNEPILARRASALYHLTKFVSRHRVFFLTAFAIGVLVAGVSIWVSNEARYLRAGMETNINMEVWRAAINEERLAQVLMEHGRYDEAEGAYRSALLTLQQIGRDDHAAKAMVGFSKLLINRPADTARGKDRDYEQAQDLLWDAVHIFEGAGRPSELNGALKLLQRLYGPELWDAPEPLAAVEGLLMEFETVDPVQPITELP